MYSDQDPIIAVATASGRGGIGIIRLSFQPKFEQDVLEKIIGRTDLTPRHAHLLPIKNSEGEILDRGIVLFFPAPCSYTGESVVELQIHGGPVLMKMALEAALKAGSEFGLRLAQPGEFTQRAFLNGRMDLAQAESVADLINASSEFAAKAATRSLSGDFSKKVRELGEGIDKLRMFVEACLDFPEEDEDFLADAKIFERIRNALEQIDSIIGTVRQGKVLQEGVLVALVGSPNVGKSSLMNALAGEEVAIVTDIAGTTRDRIEHHVVLQGVPIRLVDTAGIRETTDIVERKGIERTLDSVRKADLILHLVDASGRITDSEDTLSVIMKEVKPNIPIVTVANKIDEGINIELEDAVKISAVTREGIDVLTGKLLKIVGMNNLPEGVFIARERHLNCLREARNSIERAMMFEESSMIELLAEELRRAGKSLGEILGETTTEDILGMIFTEFCIGK